MPGEFAMKQALWKGCHERSASGCVGSFASIGGAPSIVGHGRQCSHCCRSTYDPQHFVGGAPTINARLEAETPVTICGISHWIQWFKADFRTVDESLSAQPKGG